MNSTLVVNPFTPAHRLGLLALVFALVGLGGVVSFVGHSRVELTTLSLPVALGLLTRRDLWRKAALGYVVLLAALSLLLFALNVATAPSATAPVSSSVHVRAFGIALLPIVPPVALFILTLGVLRRPDVSALFRPSLPKHGS